MTRTGLQVITDALKLLGVVAGHEVPTSAEQLDAFARLNELIDSWGLSAHTLLVARRDVVPLIVGQQTYLVGPGLDVDLPTPITVDAVSYVVAGTPDTEVFLALGLEQTTLAEPQKDLTGSPPLQVSYTRTHSAGELWIWPVPSVAQDVVLYWKEPLAAFPDLITPVDLAAGYARALRSNLALELAPEFGKQVDPMVAKMAAESLADVKRANFPMVEVGIDPALTGGGGGYDILTDS